MKKLNLSIPTPCHENWDHMSQEEKGKFCGACQKTVIDFTNMSDRQLAEFFRKPKGNVCGRFNNDQLDRPIVVPRKRIPWIKYFFQFTWPAFVLFLKSCGDKDAVQGKIKVEKVEKIKEQELQTEMLGSVMPDITAVDFQGTVTFKYDILESCDVRTMGIIIAQPDTTQPEKLPATIKGEVSLSQEEQKPLTQPSDDSMASTTGDTVVVSKMPMEEVVIVGYPSQRKSSIMGAVSTTSQCTTNAQKNTLVNPKENITEKPGERFLVYPNPLAAGSILTLSFSEKNIPEQVQVISSSGQLIASVQQDLKEYATTSNIRIPSNLDAGVYFVRLVSKDRILNTAKLVVTR